MNIRILDIFTMGIVNGRQYHEEGRFYRLDSSSVWHLRGYFSAKVSCSRIPNGQILEHVLIMGLMQILRPNTIAFMGGICGFPAEIALNPMSLSQRISK